MSTKEASRAASAAFHAKRKAEGWRKVTVWLSPTAVANLEALKAEHGWPTDEAVRRCLSAGSPAERPKKALSVGATMRDIVPRALATDGGGKGPDLPKLRLPVGPPTYAPGALAKKTGKR